MRVLWISDLVAPTGFSRVSHSILKYKPDDLEFIGLGVNYRGDPHNYPLAIFPASGNNPSDLYGIGRLKEMVKYHPDLIFILNDAWIVNNYLKEIKEVFKENLPEIVVYMPVDAEGHRNDWYEHFDIVSQLVVYTQFGKSVVSEAKSELADKIMIIPHGVDSEIFYPIEKQEAREKLFGTVYEQLKDSFIVLNANRNQPRKRIDISANGFSLFALDKPDTKLYLHCGIIDTSMDLNELSNRYSIQNKLLVTSHTVKGIQRVSDEMLNLIYNSCDVGINTSLGEGWGLTNIEHAATGNVQIVPDHSACREVFEDVGILIPVEYTWTLDNLMTLGKVVSPSGLADSLNKVYYDRDYKKLLEEKALFKFSQKEYNWENISKQWFNLFEEVLKK